MASNDVKRWTTGRGYDGETRISNEYEDAPIGVEMVLASDHDAAMSAKDAEIADLKAKLSKTQELARATLDVLEMYDEKLGASYDLKPLRLVIKEAREYFEKVRKK